MSGNHRFLTGQLSQTVDHVFVGFGDITARHVHRRHALARESPDNVSYPLSAPRVYVPLPPAVRSPRVNLADIWLRDPAQLDEVLVQARANSYGLRGIGFVTRSGVRVLLDQAAGIVIDLLVALSLIALATAGVMLAASARAEVQRRLKAIGVRRAVAR